MKRLIAASLVLFLSACSPVEDPAYKVPAKEDYTKWVKEVCINGVVYYRAQNYGFAPKFVSIARNPRETTITPGYVESCK